MATLLRPLQLGDTPSHDANVPARILAVIPAHNEEHCIEGTLQSLACQTRPPHQVVVIADNCTDCTADVAKRHAEVFVTQANGSLKAGAINQALEHFLPTLRENDAVLVMDADSELDPHFLEAAQQQLDPAGGQGVAAVGTVYYGRPGGGLLGQLQRNEYQRSIRLARRATDQRVTWCLSGVATLLRVDALLAVRQARLDGRLPVRSQPGIYSENELTEDFEMTLALRSLGYDCVAQTAYPSHTDVMPTVAKFWHQRIRWLRGCMEGVRLYGLSRLTMSYVIRLSWCYIVSLIGPVWLALTTLAAVGGQLAWSPLWQAIFGLFLFERLWTVRREGSRGLLLSMLMLPEMVYDTILQALHLWTAVLCLTRAPRHWVVT